jgi:hypothetical protein
MQGNDVGRCGAKSVDKWRAKREDKPSRAEAIRRIVELGLKAKNVRFAPLRLAAIKTPEPRNKRGESNLLICRGTFPARDNWH